MSRITIKFSFLLLFTAILLLTTITDAQAQRFKGTAVLGLNLAQIDGDNLYGYNKLGLHGGFKLDYPLASKLDLSLEMLFSGRGSTAGFGFGSTTSEYTSLQYLDLPIMLSIKDWFIAEKGYYKVSAHGGLGLAYLFSVTTANDQYQASLDKFNSIDFSYFFGITYRFNKRLGITIRHTRAFTKLRSATDPVVEYNDVSYFATVRTEFYF